MPGTGVLSPPTGFEDLIPQSGGSDPTGFEDLIPKTAPSSTPSWEDQVKAGGQDVIHAVEHPWQTLKGLGTSALSSARDAFSDKVIGTVPDMQTVSPNEQLQLEKSLGQSLPRVTAQTPGAITPKRALLGAVNTASIPVFALAPELALPARVGVNAGLGAINNLDEPLRGAIGGAALGEVLHLPHVAGNIADVSGGVSDAISEGAKEGIGNLSDEAQLWGPNRRPVYTLPVKDRPALEPPVGAEAVSSGGADMTPIDQLLATREYLGDRGRLDTSDQIGRRPGPPPPVDPPPEAETQSFGGRVGRRPGGVVPDVPPPAPMPSPTGFEDLIPPAPPVEPPPTAETVSAGGLPDVSQAPRLAPVVSASPDAVEARPGVIRAANKAIPDEPAIRAPVPPPSVGRGNTEDVTGTQSFEGVQSPADAPASLEPRPSDILNVAKLNLEDKTAQQRVADQLEQFRSQREQNKQTFAEADVNRKAIVNELLANNPKALSPASAAKLSGEELLARRDVVNQNDQLIGDLSKSIESGQLSPEEHEQATQLLNKAVEHNDALLSDLVTGSSQKGRDLNLLRRMANTSLDADVWMVQAKRMLGDQPMTDEVMSNVRRLVNAAKEACGG